MKLMQVVVLAIVIAGIWVLLGMVLWVRVPPWGLDWPGGPRPACLARLWAQSDRDV